MSNQYTPWTDKELNQLREMAGKRPASEIALEIGRGYDSIQKMCRKLDLPSYVKPVRDKAVKAPVAPVETVEVVDEPESTPEPPYVPVVRPVTIRAYVAPTKALRQAPKPKASVNYPPTELCPVHGCLVSDWPAHIQRLGNVCKRPAA